MNINDLNNLQNSIKYAINAKKCNIRDYIRKTHNDILIDHFNTITDVSNIVDDYDLRNVNVVLQSKISQIQQDNELKELKDNIFYLNKLNAILENNNAIMTNQQKVLNEINENSKTNDLNYNANLNNKLNNLKNIISTIENVNNNLNYNDNLIKNDNNTDNLIIDKLNNPEKEKVDKIIRKNRFSEMPLKTNIKFNTKVSEKS